MNKTLAATALLRLTLFPFISEKVLERSEQEGAKAALLLLRLTQVIFFQQFWPMLVLLNL